MLGHVNEMAGYLERDLRRHGRRPGYVVAQMLIHRDQFRASTDGAQIGRLATGAHQILFGELHQAPSETAALQRGTQGKQSHVTPAAAHFSIYTTGKSLVVFEEEKLAAAKQRL